MPGPFRNIRLVLAALALLVAACGDDDTSETTAAPGTTGATATTDAPATTAAAETTHAEATPSLSATVEGLAGHQGKIVVGVLTPAAGDGPVGFVCLPIDADPWSGTGTFSTSGPDNPCDKEAPYGEVIDTAGDYMVNLGVYTPGESTAEVCFEAPATLFGPSSISVPGEAFAPNCTG